MLTLLIIFGILYAVGGALGIVFKVAYHLFKWVFLAALVIGAGIFVVAFAVPVLFILPLAVVLFLLFCGVAGAVN